MLFWCIYYCVWFSVFSHMVGGHMAVSYSDWLDLNRRHSFCLRKGFFCLWHFLFKLDLEAFFASGRIYRTQNDSNQINFWVSNCFKHKHRQFQRRKDLGLPKHTYRRDSEARRYKTNQSLGVFPCSIKDPYFLVWREWKEDAVEVDTGGIRRLFLRWGPAPEAWVLRRMGERSTVYPRWTRDNWKEEYLHLIFLVETGKMTGLLQCSAAQGHRGSGHGACGLEMALLGPSMVVRTGKMIPLCRGPQKEPVLTGLGEVDHGPD